MKKNINMLNVNSILNWRIFAIFIFIIVLVSCSTKPKNPGDIVELRILGEKELARGNVEAGRGNLEIAYGLIRESNIKAIITDDVSLMIRSGLSLGNVLFTQGYLEEASKQWESSIALAKDFDNKELLSVSIIFAARGKLLGDLSTSTTTATAQSVLIEVNNEANKIKTDKLYIAFSWQVKGLALRELGSYKEAEDAVKHSLSIHEGESYLENASYDLYLIANIRSLNNDTKGALEALNKSIELDRRVENSWGLASSWRAIGDVYKKTGNKDEANKAYERAIGIFKALGNNNEVSIIQERMK